MRESSFETVDSSWLATHTAKERDSVRPSVRAPSASTITPSAFSGVGIQPAMPGVAETTQPGSQIVQTSAKPSSVSPSQSLSTVSQTSSPPRCALVSSQSGPAAHIAPKPSPSPSTQPPRSKPAATAGGGVPPLRVVQAANVPISAPASRSQFAWRIVSLKAA